VNALLFLRSTTPDAWSIEQLNRATKVMDAVEASVTPATGRLTLQRVSDVRKVIAGPNRRAERRERTEAIVRYRVTRMGRRPSPLAVGKRDGRAASAAVYKCRPI
jgi:hypothetical protein